MEGRSASSMSLFTTSACSWHGMCIKLSPITSIPLHPGFDNPVINLLTFYPCSQSVRRFCLLLTFDLPV
ncbi:hypothetical protein BDR07DRAFT_1457046 [Suillus spraguei]|nr:hypothetical protein BDR07DRAFT_1457046 [Suillus spraguei]